ncbi:MAG: penicillin-binding protein activator LpoB [Burkholderiaceae bacterium]
MKQPKRLFLSRMTGLSALLLAACTTTHVPPGPQGLETGAQWGLLPIVNYTQTPQAGLRAEAIVESMVRSRGVDSLRKYPSALNTESLFEPAERNAVDKALAWAREERLRYALTGTVDEWRYKVGVDGEPAIGMTLQLIDIESGRVLWSATGSKTGWSREGLSAVAQKLIDQMTSPLAQPTPGRPGGS